MAENISEVKEYSPFEPVPQEARHMSFMDTVTTWAGATLQPTVWTLGGTMICVGVFAGLAATAISSAIAYMFVGLFGLMTWYTGTNSSGMSRFTLGIRGSAFFSVASIINSCGWSVVSNYMAAITYSYLFQLAFGTPAYGEPGCEGIMILGCLLNGILSYLAVGVGGTRLMKVFQKWMMIALVVLSCVLFYILLRGLTWADIASFTIPDEMRYKFFSVFDMMLATILAMSIIGGDLGRDIKKTSSATWAPMIGGVIALLVFIFMGMLGIILNFKNTGLIDMDAANPSTLAMSLGLGAVALIVVLFATVTTNMMDVFTMTNNVENICPKIGYKKAAIVGGLLPMLFCWLPISVSSFFDVFYGFTDLLGALFPPLFTIILIDFFILRKKKVDMSQIEDRNGKYWYTNGFNIYAFAAWIIGAVLFYVLHNVLAITFFSNCIISIVIIGVLYYVIGSAAFRKGYCK